MLGHGSRTSQPPSKAIDNSQLPLDDFLLYIFDVRVCPAPWNIVEYRPESAGELEDQAGGLESVALAWGPARPERAPMS